jgi:creatinine amidohydrolase/Fe(II)-dependent formamide hydrolase-like protein
MLMAVDGDPTLCGYAPEQVDRCMKDLVNKGINQERNGVEHLGHLLKKRGLIDRTSLGSVRVRERPYMMKLRFASEESPQEGIPVDLREPLYRIYLEHADGATRKSGRTWIDFDLMADPALDQPYPFDPVTVVSFMDQNDPKPSFQNKRDYLLGELTWPEAEKRFRVVDLALLPVGAIEQHGPHLPLDSDAFDADYLARRVAESCSEPKPFVLPLVAYGVSYHHEDFSGTISISPETLSQMVYDIGISAVHHGITKLVIINGHGGNGPALHFAAQMLNRDAHIFTCVDTGETSDPDIYAMAETPNDVHAGEIETSTTLASRPHLVRTGKARKFIPRFSIRYLDFTSKRSVGWYAHTSKISPLGVLGDPTKATREKGERMWQVMIKNLVEFIEDLKSMSLDEIYQKRY